MEQFLTLQQQAQARWNSRRSGDQTRITVGIGSCSIDAGGLETLEAVRNAVSDFGMAASVEQVGCNGMCWAEPLVTIAQPGEGAVIYGSISATEAAELLRDVLMHHNRRTDRALGVEGDHALDSIAPFAEQPYFQVQRRRLLARCGVIDPESLDDYLANGGYEGLDKVLSSMQPEEIVKTLSDANLTGRGGANFPAGRKWDFLRTATATPKYLVCNADEGDPGAFVNRILLESDPHLVIEGMVIGSFVTGASHGYVYIRDEYLLAVERMRHAVQQARDRGFLGNGILGSSHSFELEVVRGAGAYVCGEETGLIASIQDYRGMPRIKPPFPAQAGVFYKPTNVNNVETYAYVPGIILNGVDWFATVGTERNKGTKLFSLSGRVNQVCIVEVDLGTPIRTLLEVCGGGLPDGHTLKGIQQGGPLGGIIPPEWLDTQLDPANFAAEGTIMGSGGLIFLDDRDCVVDICKWLTTFDQDESCGRCTTCRVGAMRMVDILERMTCGQGEPNDIIVLQQLEDVMQNANCVHGQFTPKPFNAAYKWFKAEFESHILEKRCPAMACREMVEYVIDPAASGGATVDRLVASCPVDAIVKEGDSAIILQSKCIRCGLCAGAAPQAVSVRPRTSYSVFQREVRYG